MAELNEKSADGLRMMGISGVTYVDDDGTRRKREIRDGEIHDYAIGHVGETA